MPEEADALAGLAAEAATAAAHLRCLANTRRLIVLYHLAAYGEIEVGSLANAVGLGQSAMSQHLALLRKADIVTTRRARQTIYYRLSDCRVERLLRELWEIHSGTDGKPPEREGPAGAPLLVQGEQRSTGLRSRQKASR